MVTKHPANPALTKTAPLPPSKGPTMPRKPPPSTAQGKTPKEETKAPGTALVSYKERMAALVAQTKKAEAPAGGFLSTKGGRLSNGEVRLPNDMIRAIIIDYRKDNEFYAEAYEAGKSSTPVCYAVVQPYETLSPWRKPRDGESLEGMIYDKERGLVTEAPEPQVAAGAACDTCTMAEWGSAKYIKGKAGKLKGPACRMTRRLHVMAADQCTTPGDIERAPYMTLIPPPTSLDNFKRVANEITEVLGAPIFGAVVDISVVPHDNYMFMVQYKIVDQIRDEGLLMALLQRHEQISAKNIVMPKPDADDATKDARGSKF